MKCKYCETELEEDWEYCPNCCSKISEQEKVKKKTRFFEFNMETIIVAMVILLQIVLIFFDISNGGSDTYEIRPLVMILRILISCGNLSAIAIIKDKQPENLALDVLLVVQIIYIILFLPILLFRDFCGDFSCSG